MDIPHFQELKKDAAFALSRGREPKKVVLYYAGFSLLAALCLSLLNYWLDSRFANAGGLGNLGLRSVLSTAQALLPMIQSVLLVSLQLGYLHAMLRVSRGQYADQTDLKVGFRRFFPMLRMSLLQGLMYFGIGIAAFYLAMQIFMLTPWYDELYTVMMPYVSGTTVPDPAVLAQDPAFVMQMAGAMLPMLLIYFALYVLAALILSYRFRMATYTLLDNPEAGALAALSASSKMMRRNSWKLFQVDLHFWWFFLLQVLCGIIGNGDVILAAAGIVLPIPEILSYFLFYAAAQAAVFAVTYAFQNRVELTYIMAYESICPRPKDQGAVLGNIFDM